MHGNVWQWCQESAADYDATGMEDKEDPREITDQTSRALRGGAFNDPWRESRAAFRHLNRPASRLVTFGLRPARTARCTTAGSDSDDTRLDYFPMSVGFLQGTGGLL